MIRALLVDVDYVTHGEKAVIRLILKGKRFFRLYDPSFLPYFYVDTTQPIDRSEFGESIVEVRQISKMLSGKEKILSQVFCRHPREVPLLSAALGKYGSVYENRIVFGRRYLIDKRLRPMNYVEIERNGKRIVEIKDAGEGKGDVELKVMSFDIETYNPIGTPRMEKDPILIVSYADAKGGGALTWKSDKGAEVLPDEKSVIKRFGEIVRERDVELFAGYNSAAFDVPYLKERAKVLGIGLSWGRDKSEPRVDKHGMVSTAEIEGRIHFDLFYTVRLLRAAGALKTQRFTLEEVYEEMMGKTKEDVDAMSIWKMWDSGDIRELISYAKSDAVATYELFMKLFPMQVELSRLTQLPLQEVSGATSGQLVEATLMSAAHASGRIIPNKPAEEETSEREDNPIEGAYVKMPQPGVYENIAVFDFRGLYPSIIVSHNVDPETFKCGHVECKEGNVSPMGHHFCTKTKGLIPATIEGLIERRKNLKKELKGVAENERALINARVSALKIVSNSFYGYLGYARSRWYSREAAESITAWGRYYIKDVARRAEEEGFEVLYSDTDSIFLLIKDKSENEALSFVEKVNKSLPETMELELEDFYTRGVFVAKKSKGEKGAKKKYALINRDGKIKIRGFELVRRDWSRIARETQRAVLETILKEGSKEKAVAIVKDTVARLREGRVAKEDLIIYTQLRQKNYEVASPELAAAQKARKRGMKMPVGTIVGYIVTKSGKTISEKAELAEFAQDYDPDYYVDNQILPSVLRILGELGYSEEDIKYTGKQSSLGGWF